jgi:hypothetical protein
MKPTSSRAMAVQTTVVFFPARSVLGSAPSDGSAPSRLSLDPVLELFAKGRHEGRAYEATELVAGGTLAEASFPIVRASTLQRRIVDDLGRAHAWTLLASPLLQTAQLWIAFR